jgi:glycosyltransferase involved in cell wall biosynthesis
MIDIVNAYANEGYPCVLMTGRLVVRNKPLNPLVKVEHITRYDRSTKLSRLRTWITGTLQILIKLITTYRKDDLFIVSNPPTATLLPLVVRNRFSLLIFDIYPDVLTELKYLSPGSFIIRLWKRWNRKVFGRAAHIFTITDGMGGILQNYSTDKPVQVVPLWTDNSFLKPVEAADNHFLTRYGLNGKFIVLYSGNIGLASEVDVMIDVASGMHRDDILFLIIGDGPKKEPMAKRVHDEGLTNVMLLPSQPVSELPYSFSSAHLAVVALGKGETKLAVPSKLYNYLSVGAPLLCLSAEGSEVQRLVEKYHCGQNFEPDDIEGIAGFINHLVEDPDLHSHMRKNSLAASKDFSGDNVLSFMPEALPKTVQI